MERTHAWHNAFKKLVWWTERRAPVTAFYVTFASAVIIVRRLIWEGWKRYRWDGRPRRCPCGLSHGSALETLLGRRPLA